VSDLVDQPARTAQQRDPPPHRRHRHLPQRAAIIRLVGAVRAEQTDEWTEGRGYMGLEILAKARLTPITNEGTNTEPATTELTAA
jgi:hypothetical protein